MQITKKLIKYNFTKCGNSKKYIVIHDTGNSGKGAGAMNHYTYFNGGDRGASAHYFVDDKLVLHVVEDNDRSWHCGVKYGTSQLRREVTNSNSIGIEICVNPESNCEVAFNNAIELTKHLMKLYNISSSNVVRHFDACAKTCPSSMKADNWALWDKFKNNLGEKDVFKVGELTIINEKEY
ncbi:MAG: N-acetylmuramoyl-L-alanine amidase family protein [Lachnospirales bacterium]